MVTPPALVPVTTPEVEPTVATVVGLEAHVPPETAFERVTVAPTQAVDGPDITDGAAFTVISRVVKHPLVGTI